MTGAYGHQTRPHNLRHMSIDFEKNIEFLFQNMEDEIKERNRKRAEIWALKSFRDRSTKIMEEIKKMNVNGIGAGYPAAGYGTRRTERNVAGRNFAEQAADAAQATATLHGAEEGSGDIAISSWADVVSGSSISVYKTQDFDAANPVYKVKTWDKSGNVTEQMVDVSKVDPENCDTVEMYAYTAHLKESGKGSFEDTVLKAAVAKAVKNAEQRSAGSWSFSEKTDWVKIVNDITQSEYQYGDLKGYMEWKKFLGFLEK